MQLAIIRAAQRNRSLYRWLMFRHADLRDRANGVAGGLPPAELRYRVSNSPHAEEFIAVGNKCAADIEAALCTVGMELNSFDRILDFGCGCGRTLIHLRKLAPQARFSGTDIDAKAIEWCRQNLNYASFSLSKEIPPIGYAADSFDLIYVVSVFTHLNEEYQFRWLEELRRLTKPGGIVLVTVNEAKNGLGFLFERSYEEGLFPPWYQTAYHSKQYIFDHFKEYFAVLNYLPRGMNNHQDVVVLQKGSHQEAQKAQE